MVWEYVSTECATLCLDVNHKNDFIRTVLAEVDKWVSSTEMYAINVLKSVVIAHSYFMRIFKWIYHDVHLYNKNNKNAKIKISLW